MAQTETVHLQPRLDDVMSAAESGRCVNHLGCLIETPQEDENRLSGYFQA